MLIKNTNYIVRTLKLELVFEDDIVKNIEISVGDIVTAKYNRNGLQETITGKVVDINDKCNSIKIDGSSVYKSKVAVFNFENILDAVVLDKDNYDPDAVVDNTKDPEDNENQDTIDPIEEGEGVPSDI